jgi:dihydrofolate reductase
VFIIGGGQIYKEALAANVVDEMFITHVHGAFGADTFFPEIDASAWNSEIVSTHSKDEKHAYGFEILKYERK